MSTQPFVLIIDDDPSQESFALSLSAHGVDVKHVLPDDLTAADLNRASLVLIDEFIEHWTARETIEDHIGLFVRDGVALAAVLRSAIDGRGPSHEIAPRPRNTALVLRTGHLEILAEGTPEFIRPMTVASRHDLEWVADKKTSADAPALAALASLAIAAAALPTSWEDPTDPRAQIIWLGLDGKPWRDDALAQIELCRPPWSVLAATSAGRRWLSWFVQRILPFPTFLVDDQRAASYLGLAPRALDALLAGSSEAAIVLRQAVYTGQLSGFAGRRWWRAGIAALKQLALEVADGRGADDIAHALAKLHGTELPALGLRHPVFQIDADYKVIDSPLEITEAVRLQPDGWPSYADSAWLATASIHNEDSLAALIVIDDRAESSDGSA
jgi:hypothetical protein